MNVVRHQQIIGNWCDTLYLKELSEKNYRTERTITLLLNIYRTRTELEKIVKKCNVCSIVLAQLFLL